MYLLLLSTLINIFHYYYYNLYFIWLYSKIELPMYSKLSICVCKFCVYNLAVFVIYTGIYFVSVMNSCKILELEGF